MQVYHTLPLSLKMRVAWDIPKAFPFGEGGSHRLTDEVMTKAGMRSSHVKEISVKTLHTGSVGPPNKEVYSKQASERRKL